MKLYKEILIKALESHTAHVTFPDLTLNAAEVIEGVSYQAVDKIKAAIQDDSLSDFECMDAILSILEDIGVRGMGRHDF